MEDRVKFNNGDIVNHFKIERLSDFEKASTNMCKYVIICEEANHSENGEKYVVYKSLESGKVYVRPYDSFYSEVDKNKYPDIKQKYRFELAIHNSKSDF